MAPHYMTVGKNKDSGDNGEVKTGSIHYNVTSDLGTTRERCPQSRLIFHCHTTPNTESWAGDKMVILAWADRGMLPV